MAVKDHLYKPWASVIIVGIERGIAMINSPKDYEYTTLMNMLHVSVSKHLLDEHFTLVWANDFYYDLIGYPKEEYEALYHNRPDLYYIDYQDLWNQLGSEVMKALSEHRKGFSMVAQMPRKGGSLVWVQISAAFVDDYIDGSQVSYTAMTDISEIMQIQKEQSITYDNLPGFVGKYLVDKDFNFILLDASERFVSFFGEGCWNNLSDSLFKANLERNSDVFLAQKEKILAGETVRCTVRMENQHGEEAWLQINATCIDWQEGSPVYLALYIDITNETVLRQLQKQLEEQSEELKKALYMAEHASRAKTDFLSHMSHDIRTPMNAIVGMTDIAQAHIDDPMKVQDCLKKISLSSQHLLGLINDVLDMSRIESGSMTINEDVLSLPELLENVIAIMQPQVKARDQKFSIRLKHVEHEQFHSDALRMRQIFINILSNASKFTPVGGSITVNVEELNTREDNRAVFRFVISDTGMGMKAEFVEHLFEPFSREQDSRVDKTEGSGLGMAITKKLVDLLEGEIGVESHVGEGTTFTVTLPLPIEDTPSMPCDYSDLKVLLVDDDETMCEHMAEMMDHLGICVDHVSTGEAALVNIRETHELGHDYDAVFLDWKLPQMDGPETAQKIRGLVGVETPILIVSAYDWSDIETEAMEAGVNGFLSKPLFVSTLCRALRQYVLHENPDRGNTVQTDEEEFAGKHFLLVEDNELNREIAMEQLNSAGAVVECAPDGAEGIKKFEQSPPQYYDLILMDIQMPVMNGYEATEKIRHMDRDDAKEVPILAMTADAFAEDIVKAKNAGMNGHLAKPLNIGVMKKEIHAALKSRKIHMIR